MRNRLSKCSKHVAFAACLLALGGSISSCHDEYTLDDAKPVWLNSSIYETLESDGNYKNYLRLIADPDVNTGESEESSLVQILSKTGSKTVFVANDQAWESFFKANEKLKTTSPDNPWCNATSYENLSKSQKKLLLHTSMLNNAIVMENLSSSSGTNQIRGEFLRRFTDVEAVDSVMLMDVESLPKTYWTVDKQATAEGAEAVEVDQWSRIRGTDRKSIYMVADSSLSMMLHFTNEYMAKNQITDKDFRVIMGQERITDDVHIYDARLDSADIVCENGYINMTAKPLVPLANMAEVIRTNGRTRIFSHILDRFSVPFQNKTVGRLYSKLNPNFLETDTLYTKRYYSKRTYGSTSSRDVALTHDEKGNLFGNTGEAILKFDPGWSGYFPTGATEQEDMGAMFVPNDEVMLAYFSRSVDGSVSGTGYSFIQEYTKNPYSGQYSLDNLQPLFEDIDQIPLKIVQDIINQVMFEKFTASVPSKMLNLREPTTQEQIFQESDTRLASDNNGGIDTVLLANNGAVYIMNRVFTPSNFNCVATPAYIRSSNRIMRWAIFSDSELKVPEMNMNYYAYLKAMQSRYTFLLPNDTALLYYYDPISFTTKYPRVMRFLYTSGNFPFALNKNKEGVAVFARYDIATGTIGGQPMSPSLSTGEIKNRLRNLLEHHTIVHENVEDSINKAEDEYYLSKNGMGMKVIRENGVVTRVLGGFQLENERENLEHNHPGIRYCKVLENQSSKNGITFTLDAPVIPAARSIFNVMSGIKRGDDGTDETTWNKDPNSNPYLEFFQLCSGNNAFDLITRSGLVDETDEKYQYTRPLPSDPKYKALQNAVNKFQTFHDNNAIDYNVTFLANYRYTVFAPTNEAVREAIANGLPTWESIKQDFDNCAEDGYLTTYEDSIRIQSKITYLVNFIRTHFADNSIFADKTEKEPTEMFTSSFNNETGLFVKIQVKREREGNGTMLKVASIPERATEAYSLEEPAEWITTQYDWNGVKDAVKNILTCDREQSASVKDKTSITGTETVSSSFAVVHLINGVLNHEELNDDNTYPTFDDISQARKYLKKFAIR